jgi:hypothetical protein
MEITPIKNKPMTQEEYNAKVSALMIEVQSVIDCTYHRGFNDGINSVSGTNTAADAAGDTSTESAGVEKTSETTADTAQTA